MMKTMGLRPAYGRDYKSMAAVKKDFEADKDFIITDFVDPDEGRPVNRADLVNLTDVTHVMIRYSRLMKVMSIKLKR